MTGSEIKFIRRGLALTQESFARLLGCSVGTIRALERGQTKAASHLLDARIREILREKGGEK